jgi:maltokinase
VIELSDYLSQARWFGGKGRPFRVTDTHLLGVVPSGEPGGVVPVVAVAVVDYDDDEGGRDLYQLPLARYAERQPGLEHALVGTEDGEHGQVFLYDAVHDRDAMACWLRSFAAGASAPPFKFHRLPGHDLDLETHSTLFSGEQSNSSVAFGEDSLLKVFRRVTPGVNPDIEIHDRLTRAGSDHVAALYGWVEADASSLPAELVGSDGAVLQLGFLQQFLRTASDGWDLAQASVRNLFAEGDLHAEEVGGDFAAESARLGEAVAEVHTTLRAELGEHAWDTAEVASAMQARLDAAARVVPELAAHREALSRTFDRFATLGTLTVQRVHGDLHLGQTLRTVRGWKIVDFEGEPAKSLAERSRPDSPWRDIAGMLRSFDYAAQVVERTMGADSPASAHQLAFRATEWVDRNSGAFLAAYAGRDLAEDEQTMLEGYLADKAVYEAVYEARNRPTWLDIPLKAITRLTGVAAGPSSR